MNETLGDETISSWLERQLFYASLGGEGQFFCGMRGYLDARADSDADYYSDQDFSGLVSMLPYIPPDLSLHKKPATFFMLIPSSERINFCPACVKDDLKTKKTAVWREQWSLGWYVICVKHRCILCSLGTEHRVGSTKYRAEKACKFLIEHGYLSPQSHQSNEHPLSSKLPIGRPIRELAKEIDGLAFIMQLRIQQLIMYKPSISSGELALIYDLMSVMLRSHVRRTEATPFCYQLVKKITGRNFSIPRQLSGDASVALSGIAQVVEPYPRLLAMALSAFLLELPGSQARWLRASQLFAEMGMLVPGDKGLLYAALAGVPELGIKSWFFKQMSKYPIELRMLCRKFSLDS
ncbi:TniQ family protein [Rhodococcus sp. IEGM1300]